MNLKINKFILIFFCLIGGALKAEVLINPEDYEANVEVIFKGKKSVRPQWSHFIRMEEKGGLKLFLAIELPQNYKIEDHVMKLGRHSFLPLKEGRGNYPFSIMGNEKILSHGNILVRIRPLKKKTFVETNCKVAENKMIWSHWTFKGCAYRPVGRVTKRKLTDTKKSSYLKDLSIGGKVAWFSFDSSLSFDLILGKALYSTDKFDFSLQGDFSLFSLGSGDKVNELSFLTSYSNNSALSFFNKMNARFESDSLSGRFIFIPLVGMEYQKRSFVFNLGLAPLTTESEYILFQGQLSYYRDGILPFLSFERVSRKKGASYSSLNFGGVVKF